MQIRNQLLNQKIYFFLLAFCLLSLPFPDYSLNTKAMIGLAVYWAFFYSSWKEKVQHLRNNKVPFWVLSSLFWMVLLGSIYTDNYAGVPNELLKKLPFLLFPLILFSSPQIKSRAFLFHSYILGVIAASLLAIAKMWYFKWNNLGEYFSYARFSEFLDRHTTYYALLIVVALLWLLWAFLHKKYNRIFVIAAGMLFVYVFYLLSVRASIIALIGGALVVFSTAPIGKMKKIVGVIVIPIALLMVYFTPHFQNRFELSTTDYAAISDIDYRTLHWRSVKETIANQSWIFGKGTDGNRDFLYEKYKEYGLSAAYELQYNAHNQFLEIVLDFGILGLLIFVGSLLYCMSFFLRHKDYFALSILVVFLTFMITESIFQRTIGIVLFSLLMSVFIIENNRNLNNKNLSDNAH